MSSSCGCGKGYGSNQQSLCRLMVQVPTEAVQYQAMGCPCLLLTGNGVSPRSMRWVLQVPSTTAVPPALHSTGSRPRGCGGLCGICRAGGLHDLHPAAYSSTRARSQVPPGSETQESSR